MNKGKGIGIGVTVIAVAIVFGIASLPDEVLLESPQLGASENLQTEMIPIDITPVEIPIEKQPIEEVVEEPVPEVVEEPVPEVVEEPVPEVIEEPENTDESEGKVITVKINDGVGAIMK